MTPVEIASRIAAKMGTGKLISVSTARMRVFCGVGKRGDVPAFLRRHGVNQLVLERCGRVLEFNVSKFQLREPWYVALDRGYVCAPVPAALAIRAHSKQISGRQASAHRLAAKAVALLPTQAASIQVAAAKFFGAVQKQARHFITMTRSKYVEQVGGETTTVRRLKAGRAA